MNKLSVFLMVLSVSVLNQNVALACDGASLIGVWSHSEVAAGLANTGKTTSWNFEDGLTSLIAKVQLTDALTVTDGPYFESETLYRISFDESSCTLSGTANSTIGRSIRVYGETMPDPSTTVLSGPSSFRYHVVVSDDGSKVTFTDEQNSSFSLILNR